MVTSPHHAGLGQTILHDKAFGQVLLGAALQLLKRDTHGHGALRVAGYSWAATRSAPPPPRASRESHHFAHDLGGSTGGGGPHEDKG